MFRDNCVQIINFHIGNSCLDILQNSQDKQNKTSGEYIIIINDDDKPMKVFCDMETDGGKNIIAFLPVVRAEKEELSCIDSYNKDYSMPIGHPKTRHI